jgi:glycosyltransferase involved in cell wall biosynthesis
MPSAREGFGLVYLEAMRAGKACIASHGSADEILRHEIDGLIIEGSSREELAEAVIRLFSNPADRARMGSAALNRMQQHFSDGQFTVRLLRAIDRVRPVASSRVQEVFS